LLYTSVDLKNHRKLASNWNNVIPSPACDATVCLVLATLGLLVCEAMLMLQIWLKRRPHTPDYSSGILAVVEVEIP